LTLPYRLLSPALGLAAVLVAAAPAAAETSLADAYRTIAGKEMVDLTHTRPGDLCTTGKFLIQCRKRR
jgi:hypothetical protein